MGINKFKLERKLLIICFLWIIFITPIYAQSSFRSPLDIPLELSGTYCELRGNHFHAGIDIRTQQREGLRIYAIEDGYISRIKVSHFGYGKALYVTHPNGCTSLYAHLSEFNTSIDTICWLKQQQFTSYEVDFYLDPHQLPVKKGDVIAFSGNTGSSQGPHLHFEIRDTQTEEVLNPLAFGFKVADTRPPVLTSIRLYQKVQQGDIHQWEYIEGSYRKITWNKGVPSFKGWDALHCTGEIGIGVETFDQQNASSFKNGVYKLKLWQQETPIFKIRFDRLHFNQLRYINAHLDYAQTITAKQKVQRLWVLTHDSLPAYKIKNRGIKVNVDSTYRFKIESSDFEGNTTTLPFYVRVAGLLNHKQKKPDNAILVKAYKGLDTIVNNIAIRIPTNSLYEDIYLETSVTQSFNTWGFPEFVVGNPLVPIHRHIQLGFPLKKEGEIPLSKYVVMYGKHCYGGTYHNGVLIASVNDFGSYTIVPDTTAPTVKGAHLKDSVTVRYSSGLVFKVTDDISGIKSYKLFINNQWELLQYEYKLQQLSHRFRHLKPGFHTVRLEVEDERKNKYEREWVIKVVAG